MLLKIHPQTPEQRKIEKVVDSLKSGGIIIYPTDSVYALGCDIYNSEAIDKLRYIIGKDDKEHFSFICNDIRQITEFTAQFDNPVFKLMKQSLPGPFTFILKANNKIPKIFHSKKRTVGMRVPEHPVPQAIVKELGHPMLSTSLKNDDEIAEYITDPEQIYDKYQNRIDIIIDSGYGGNQPSTVVDCTGDEPVIVREGKGEI